MGLWSTRRREENLGERKGPNICRTTNLFVGYFFFRVSIQRCVIKPQPNLADRVVYNCTAQARQVDPWTHRDPPRFNAGFGGQEAKHGPRLVAFQDKLKELQVGFSTNPRDQHTYRLRF